MATAPPNFLTIPTELRNTIYHLVFDPSVTSSQQPDPVPHPSPPAAPRAAPLDTSAAVDKFDTRGYVDASSYTDTHASRRLDPLRTCRQMHREAQLLALSLTPFHITGDCTYPDLFDARSRPLSAAKIGAIRHLTLTARIAHLRAMNEAWGGVPFGHPSLRLDRLTIIPRRPDASTSAYAHVADLSQCHTLAYVLTETLKTLRHVRTIEVRNHGCFSDLVWRVVYKSLVYRLCCWGGGCCGLMLECSPDEPDIDQADGWFRVHFQSSSNPAATPGNEVGDEALRLAVVPERSTHHTHHGHAS